MIIDAVALTSRDMKRTLAFYRLLGFEFPENAEGPHIEAIRREGEPRLMIDAHDLAETIIGEKPRPSNHSSFAMLCDSPGEVDRVAKEIADAGFDIVNAPWDAFWGQRYAIIADPDGYRIDLFAELSTG